MSQYSKKRQKADQVNTKGTSKKSLNSPKTNGLNADQNTVNQWTDDQFTFPDRRDSREIEAINCLLNLTDEDDNDKYNQKINNFYSKKFLISSVDRPESNSARAERQTHPRITLSQKSHSRPRGAKVNATSSQNQSPDYQPRQTPQQYDVIQLEKLVDRKTAEIAASISGSGSPIGSGNRQQISPTYYQRPTYNQSALPTFNDQTQSVGIQTTNFSFQKDQSQNFFKSNPLKIQGRLSSARKPQKIDQSNQAGGVLMEKSQKFVGIDNAELESIMQTPTKRSRSPEIEEFSGIKESPKFNMANLYPVQNSAKGDKKLVITPKKTPDDNHQTLSPKISKKEFSTKVHLSLKKATNNNNNNISPKTANSQKETTTTVIPSSMSNISEMGKTVRQKDPLNQTKENLFSYPTDSKMKDQLNKDQKIKDKIRVILKSIKKVTEKSTTSRKPDFLRPTRTTENPRMSVPLQTSHHETFLSNEMGASMLPRLTMNSQEGTRVYKKNHERMQSMETYSGASKLQKYNSSDAIRTPVEELQSRHAMNQKNGDIFSGVKKQKGGTIKVKIRKQKNENPMSVISGNGVFSARTSAEAREVKVVNKNLMVSQSQSNKELRSKKDIQKYQDQKYFQTNFFSSNEKYDMLKKIKIRKKGTNGPNGLITQSSKADVSAISRSGINTSQTRANETQNEFKPKKVTIGFKILQQRNDFLPKQNKRSMSRDAVNVGDLNLNLKNENESIHIH